MSALGHDARLRLAALQWCEEQRQRWGDHVPVKALSPFPFEGQAVHMRGPQGIFKPEQLSDGPLTIRSAIDSPYNDEVVGGGSEIRYDFAPRSREAENEGLKRLGRNGTPFIYLIQVARRPQRVEYLVVSPIFVRGWDDQTRQFTIDVEAVSSSLPESGHDDARDVDEGMSTRAGPDPITPVYRLHEVKARLHQAKYRRQVLAAYQQRCTVCELRVRPLLDAAHILADAEGGEPVITNGLGLCANHHRAMDRKILRVLPDYRVEIDQAQVARNDRSAQSVLLAYQGKRILLPREESLWPDPWRLEKAAG